jgi:phosphoglucomutase
MAVTVNTVPTKPYDGQKTGTSGLRKKTEVFMQENYLANWVQSLFNSLGEEVKGKTIALGGDGRYFNKEAAQIICKLAAGNGVKKVIVGKDGILATPAASAVIRRRQLYGGLIMSASHNPGGPKEDFGIKFNYNSGEPAPERITNEIYKFTQKISELNFGDIPDTDLASVGSNTYGDFEVEVVDPVEDYLAVLKEVFDFPAIKALVSRSDFSLVFDAMHAVTGAYAHPILVGELGASPDSVLNGVPKEDFGGGHPDPNLTYAHELVELMWKDDAPVLGAASDGDGDRNMILGKKFFITPSDSVAIIAANAQAAIPYFASGLKGVARSMPTGAAIDRVAKELGVECFETPTGWKFFGNLMDAGKCSVCGEESFGTGSDHIREKDGIWAVLAWLAILAYKNKDVPEGGDLVTVQDVAMEHWKKYGRNFFSRYDYEGVESDKAEAVVSHLRDIIADPSKADYGPFELDVADDFEYTDPIDGSVASKQGVRFLFKDGSRFVFRLSGTGSSGATIRMYVEQYSNDESTYGEDAQVALKSIIDTALSVSKLPETTGRDKPTVIT